MSSFRSSIFLGILKISKEIMIYTYVNTIQKQGFINFADGETRARNSY